VRKMIGNWERGGTSTGGSQLIDNKGGKKKGKIFFQGKQ